ncbi:ESX-5 secretion system protein EccC5 [Mycobacterium persicum]|uniref:ESX-5 secretion system protein EccC5 n=1 Tax=Mycobacterium persicum TaxID=1487726 RepID=A0ABY6RSA1_9MYCO|nr:type VII secretion protein EccCb [Mycobacterium persicum]VBA32431.1 ESX-5 secretion system protein EccC5 [Mycobacterium persicum]
MTREFTLHVKRDGAYDEAGFFAVPDCLDTASAVAFARKMARYHADSRVMQATATAASKVVDLYEILGHPDAGNIDVTEAWAATRSGPPWPDDNGDLHWGREWLRFPVGVDPRNGQTVALDLKEAHEFDGMGHHVVVVGTTGSGKSVFLTTLITSACLTHSPDSLKIAVFDFKGSALAHLVSGFPHTVAAMSNLRNDRLWIKRMEDVVYGEMERRKTWLDRAGVSDIAEYEYLRIHKKEKLRPMPHLLLIVDEFTQMFAEHDGAKAMADEVGRQGRSQGLRLIMGSQRLGHQMQGGIMSNIPVRVALRTVGDTDSREVLGSDAANHLPKKPAGAGLLKVGSNKELTRFQTAYVLKSYVPPQRAAAAAARQEAGYVEPQEFQAVGMPAAQVAGDVDSAETKVAEPRVIIGADGRTVKQVQATVECLNRLNLPALAPMWLPPLQPLPVDELVRRLRGQPWDVDYGFAQDELSRLLFPVGLEDRPFDHRQLVYAPNLAEGNCAVVGMGQSGKTVAIATMIAGAALLYHPRRLQFYVIALSGPDLNVISGLPHVGGFAREADPEQVKRIIAEMLALIDEREQAFTKLGLTMNKLRERKFGGAAGVIPQDPFGDVFLVIDGWPTFRRNWELLVDDVIRILAKGPDVGVHGIVSTSGWVANQFPSGMTKSFTSNVELKLGDNDDPTVNNAKVAKDVPFGEQKVYLDEGGDGGGEVEQVNVIKVRGRGTTMEGFHFQAGLPEVTLNGHRLEIAAAAEAIAQLAGPDSAAARVRILPKLVGIDEVFAQWEEHEREAGRRIGAGVVPFGISEIGLEPALVKFDAAPHLLLVGRPECGLSSGLATIAQAVMRVYRPSEAQIYVVDPTNDLLRVVEGDHLGAYVYREEQIRALGERLGALLKERLPATELTQEELAAMTAGNRRWSGPEIFVVIDHEETLATWDRVSFTGGGGYPLGPLIEFIPRGKEVGLHLVVARRIAQWGRSQTDPMISEILKAKSPAVVMDGDPSDGPIIDTTKAIPADPGRGLYVTDRVVAPVQIAFPVSAR